MKNRIIRPAVAACCALVGAVLFAACKENTIIEANQNVAPDTLSLTLDTRTIHDDSVVTSGVTSNIFHTVGQLTQDPHSGTVHASIFLQFVPPTTGWKIPAGYSIDSVVAVLPYAGFTWGDTLNFTAPLNYEAFQLDNGATFTASGNYFAFDSVASGTQAIGAGTLQSYTTLKDSVTVAGARVAPHLRIPLNGSVIGDLTNAINNDNTYPDFLSRFKGLRIAPKSNMSSGVLPYFRMDGGSTTLAYSGAGLLLYARNGTADTAFTFPFKQADAGHFNRVRRDTTGTTGYGSELAASRNTTNRPTMYLHGEPGGAFEITIRGIQSIPAGIVNKAELVITVDDDPAYLTGRFAPPGRIFPIGLERTSGAQYSIADRYPLGLSEPLTFIDGNLRVEPNGTRAYHLNLPREIQRALVAGEDQVRLKITGLQSFPGAYRLIAHGNAPGNPNRIRLNIVYTRQL